MKSITPSNINNMTFNEYSVVVDETAKYPFSLGILYATLGLTGEAGEVSEKIKKIYRDKNGEINDEDKIGLMKELGDVLWYVAAICRELEVKMDDVALLNMAKLRTRVKTNTIHGNGDNREIRDTLQMGAKDI